MKMMASVTALAALFGSVSAFAADENKPVDLTTTISVKNRAQCSLAVTQGGQASAVVNYVKGATLEQSTIRLDGGVSSLTVEAKGGDQCDMSAITFGYVDNAKPPEGEINFRHLVTKDGNGVFPMQYNFSEAVFTDRDGANIDPSKICTTAARVSGQLMLHSEARFEPVVTGPEHSGIRKIGGSPVGVYPGISLLHSAEQGTINSALGMSFGNGHDRRSVASQLIDRPIIFGVDPGSPPMHMVQLGISAVPGDGFYDAKTGARSDEVVADDEVLKFNATITVTAS